MSIELEPFYTIGLVFLSYLLGLPVLIEIFISEYGHQV